MKEARHEGGRTGGKKERKEAGCDARQEEGRAGGRQGRKDACQEGRKTFEMKDRRDVGQGFKGMREAR